MKSLTIAKKSDFNCFIHSFFETGFNLKTSLITTAIVFIFLINLIAQREEIQFTHLTVENGLSLNVVTEILQDSRGFLWFGTYNGLNRYDGYSFKVFMPEPSNPKSISNHSILALYEDSEGIIWIGTGDGLNKYDWKTEEFYTYKSNPQDPRSLSNNTISSILEDRSGSLWIGTSDGLNKLNKETNTFTVIKRVGESLNQDSLNSVTSIEEDHEGNLWLGTWNGLTCMQRDGKIIQQFLPDESNPYSLASREISVVYQDNSNNLWIGTNGQGLNKYDPQKGNFIHYRTIPDNPSSISDDYINAIFQDKLNNIWIGTKNGLNKYDPKGNKFIRILHDPLKPLNIINNYVFSINEDKTGLIWVGTQTGISRFYQPANKFNYYQEEKKYPEKSLSANRVSSVIIDKKNNIWVGTNEGLNEIKTEKDKIIHYYPNPKNSNSLNNKYVMAVIEDRSGIIWIGTDGGGLTRYNSLTGEFKSYTHNNNNPKSISNNGVISLCEDHNGDLWIGTWSGLNHFDKKEEKFFRYFASPTDANSLRNNIVWVIYEDSKNMIWLGTDGGGVSEFNPQTNTFNNFVPNSTNINNISGNRIFSIFESADKIMWFGTNNGLNSYDRKTGKFAVYNTKHGLPSILVNSIQEDSKSNLWISTDKGLSKFDRKNKIFINYTKREGLRGIEFSPNASYKSKYGDLYFGSSDGLLFFNPDSIRDKYLTAPIVFTDLKIYNQSVPISKDGSTILKESITYSKIIKIPPGNDVITIEFALLDYFKPRSNKFSYKLVGFDHDWNDVGSRNSTTYTNLPPGKYTFIVKASNNNTRNNEETASLSLTILPAYYETWWFRISFGFGILFSIVLIFKVRTRAIQKHNKILEKNVAERTKDLDKTINDLSQEIIERKKAEEKVQASLEEKEVILSEKVDLLNEKEILLKEIHHRVKNNLQIISSLLYLNSKKIKDKNALAIFKDSQNRVKSISLIHERLYQSKDLGRINFKEYIVKLTNDLFHSYGINQSDVQLDININNVFINIDLAVPCGLIINELISNSFKYAFLNYEEENKKGLIKIDFNRSQEKGLVLVVSDNGVGMPEGYTEKKKYSLGLQLVDTLVAQLEGTLEIDLSSGTLYKIKLNHDI